MTFLKRFAVLLVTASMVISMAGCGDSHTDESSGSTSDDNEIIRVQTDDTPVDMQGYEFTIASPFLLDKPVISEITDAEAIFEEVRHKVEKDYNCKITILAIDNYIENVRTNVMAGNKIADIIDVEGYNLIQMARSGYIIPLETVSGLDINDARFIPGYTSLTEFNGQHYGVNFMRPAEARICMLYNRDLLKQYGITEDPQQLVDSGEWTFDKFREMCIKCTRDADGDGTNDTYGLYIGLPETFGTTLVSANGARVVSSADGVAKESYQDGRALTALNFLYDLVNTDKVADYADGAEKEAISAFADGKYAFFFCETWWVNQLLKPTAGDLDYGIVMVPKGPDADDYVSPSENARNFCITSTNKDVEKSVVILNALAKYTQEYGDGDDWWTYDVQMDYFRNDDVKSTEMYMQMIEKSTFDIGVGVSDLWKAFKETVVRDSCYNNKGTPASKIDTISGKYQSVVDAVYN